MDLQLKLKKMKVECLNPSISIILPVYNSEDYLVDTIESIINQSYKKFELILVNDGSTDKSGSICDQYVIQDNRIKVIHKENGGICEARNVGMNIAIGNYLAFCDHDDIYHEDLLKESYSSAIKYDADIVKFGRFTQLVKDGKELKSTQTIFEAKCLQKQDIKENYFNLRMIEMLDCVWDSLFKRSLIQENSIQFNPLYKAGQEDIDFNSNVTSYAETIVSIPKPLYYHIVRMGFSTSAKPNINKLIAVKSHPVHLELYLERMGMTISEHRYDYALFYSKEVVGRLLHILRNVGNSISKTEKIQYVNEFRNQKEVYKWLENLSFVKLILVANKYSLKNVYYVFCMYLFVNKKYKLLKILV